MEIVAIAVVVASAEVVVSVEVVSMKLNPWY